MTTTRSTRRRIAVSAFVFFAMLSVFVVRLVDIQVVRADELSDQGEGKRSVERAVYGPRGNIVDRDGDVLAGSVVRYDITMSPKNAGKFTRSDEDGTSRKVSLAQATSELGAALGRSGDDVSRSIDSALAEDPDSDFAYLAKGVDTDTFRAVDALEIPWQFASRNPGRTYPNGAVAGNLVGFVRPDGKPLAGLELSEDACLAGVDGSETFQTGLDGVRIPDSTKSTTEADVGGTLSLSIDRDLQWFAQQSLLSQVEETGATWGTATVMEAKTGRVLAVADVPSVDPNDVGATAAEYRGSLSFSAPFEPGSTLKALTAAAVIDGGQAEPGSEIVAPYRYEPSNGANINDSGFHGDENLTLTGVLVESSNTGMSKFGERLSEPARYDYMSAFGIGESTEVGFPGESGGILHPWEDWDAQTSYATMFGQGVSMTALQVASVYQAIANHGVREPVTLVDRCTSSDGTVSEHSSTPGTRVVSEHAADATSQMLERVYTDGWLADTWRIPGYRVAAKTGTAQVAGADGGYQSGYLVSVSGFAPADDPEFVVSVSIMDPVKMNSSAASAPVFQEILSQALKSSRTVPSGAPAPDLPSNW